MITYSGRRIDPLSKFNGEFNASPGLDDLVLGMGRMPRFAGQTRRWWPVLLHALVCAQIAESINPSNKRTRWLCLMHDAHEGITGDVPAFFKPTELRGWQQEIDERLYRALAVWPISEPEHDFIKEVDELALRAEAFVVGPPAIMGHLSAPLDQDISIVEEIAELFPNALSTDGLESPAARGFMEVFADLYGDAVVIRTNDSPFTLANRK